MFQWLRDLFKKNKKVELELVPEDIIISFIVRNNKIEIGTSWSKNDAQYAEALGQMLFLITEGHFNEHIVNVLNQYCESEPSIVPFVNNAFAVWVKLKEQSEEAQKEKTDNEEEEPLVEPDSFMSSGKDEE